MEHARTLTREALVALLAAADTAAGPRVFDTRVDPYKVAELPAVNVYILHEDVDTDQTAAANPRKTTHVASVEIVGTVLHTEALSAAKAADRLAKQIEDVMATNRFLDGTAMETALQSTDVELRALDGASDPLIAEIALTYAVSYRTQAAQPELDEFLRVKSKTRIKGATEENQAEDDFNVRTTP